MYIYTCVAHSGQASDIRVAKLLGFHLAAHRDWMDRHCRRVTPRQLLVRPRTRHAHSRRLIGIIRRYYLREGLHTRITAALHSRVLCFNPQLRRVYRPFFPPFVTSLVLLQSPPRDSVKAGKSPGSELSRRIIKGREMTNSAKEIIIYD